MQRMVFAHILCRAMAITVFAGFLVASIVVARAEVPSVKTLHTLQHKSLVTELAWSPDGRRLATTGIISDLVTVWDVGTGKVVRQLKRSAAYGQSMAFMDEGRTLITSAAEHQVGVALTLWDMETGRIARHIQGADPDLQTISSAARIFTLSPDRRILAHMRRGGPGAPIAIMDTQSWVTKSTFSPPFFTKALSLSPDGKTLAIGDFSGDVALFETGSAQLLRTIPAFEGPATGVEVISFSPDGQLIAVGPRETFSTKQPPFDPVRVIKLDGTLVASFSGNLGAVRGLDWSPDSQFLTFVAQDRIVRLWNPKSNESRILTTIPSDAAFVVRFSPDGKKLASAGSNVAVISELR